MGKDNNKDKKDQSKTLELNSGNLDIRNTQALFAIASHLKTIGDNLKALNTRAELYYADCMQKKGQ